MRNIMNGYIQKIFILFCVVTLAEGGLSAQSAYTLDWSDPSTYTVTCGAVNSAQWTVKKDTCYYYSPLLSVGTGGSFKQTDFSVRINQSGNLEPNDFAYIFIDTNGTRYRTTIIRGDTINAVFTLNGSILVSSGSTFQISTKLKTDKNTEFWQIKNGDIGISFTPTPLPVELLSFNGINRDNYVSLTWKTSSEKNNNYFTIERSEDGSVFTPIEKIKGSGSTTQVNAYSFNDYAFKKTAIYYRLSNTDFNGTTKQIGITEVDASLAGKQSVSIVPNPYTIGNKMYLDIKGFQNEELMLKLSDSKGNVVFQKITIPETDNEKIIALNTDSDIKPGLYFLMAFAEGIIIKNKVLVR